MHRRRIVWWLAAPIVIVLLAGGLVWRIASSREVIESVPLSSGQYNVRFLKADIGTLNYSSDDKLRAFLRPRLPGTLVKKLGEVTTVSWASSGKPEFGEPPLIMLFQLLTPRNAVQPMTSTVFEKIEFPESTGFVFTEEIGGYSSHGQGTSFHHISAFPRRQPTLDFRLYEMGGKLLMERSIPNPGWKPDFPAWTLEALPATTNRDGMEVTLKSLFIDRESSRVNPVIDARCDDASWLKPSLTHNWTDATGNHGPWLSPFEPAWKLHLRLRRRRDAEFPAGATWNLEGLEIPSIYGNGIEFSGSTPSDPAKLGIPLELKVAPVDQARVVDGIGLTIRYVAPAAKIREEAGKMSVSPPSNPGRSGMSTSSGSTGSGANMVRFNEIDVGMPFIRVDHDPLPSGVELMFRVRDEAGKLLNDERLHPEMGGVNGGYFQAVYYAGRPETKTLSLEVHVSRPRDFEFVIAPPAELREGIK